MSGRSCSNARTVFFTGEAQLFHGPPDRRQTGGRAQGHLQFRKSAVGLLADQRRERVQLGREHRMPPVPLLARGDFAGLAPPLFEPLPRPRPPACQRRYRGALVREDPSNRRALILLQDVARRSTMNRLLVLELFEKRSSAPPSRSGQRIGFAARPDARHRDEQYGRYFEEWQRRGWVCCGREA